MIKWLQNLTKANKRLSTTLKLEYVLHGLGLAELNAAADVARNWLHNEWLRHQQGHNTL